ncbi:MAG: hypothetical protein QNJ17_00485 [Desulfocapsaceae bacterium]|nr:hypothetical protein [Desulfocapsaceae bacterium]
MPVIIEEVIADIQEPVTRPSETMPAAEQQPLTQTELELARRLERIRQRQERLRVD